MTGCSSPLMYNCSNSTKCIHQDLVCDGHKHCNDGSDEGENLCSVCPSPKKNHAATFSCTHRYTKNKICAVPCDKKDDLCENNEDENCELLSKHFLGLIAGTLIAFIALTGELLVYFLESSAKPDKNLGNLEDSVNEVSMVSFPAETKNTVSKCKQLNILRLKKVSFGEIKILYIHQGSYQDSSFCNLIH